MHSDPRPAALVVAAAALAGCGDNLSHPPARDPYGDDAGTLACVPNLDGRIDAAELRAALGVPVSYLVSPAGSKRTVDVAGQEDAAGHLVWDYSQDFANDTKVSVTATDLTGKWYAASFPSGELVAALDAAGTLDGVYASDDHTIALLGIASHVEAPKEGKTLVVYDAPIDVYRFPLEPGASWVSTGEVTDGTIRGLPYAGKDVYEIADDAVGQLVLHDLTFSEVHRVRTKVTVAPAVGASTFERQVSFVFECFGEVTRATSEANEPNADFTTAAEVRRLGQ